MILGWNIGVEGARHIFSALAYNIYIRELKLLDIVVEWGAYGANGSNAANGANGARSTE